MLASMACLLLLAFATAAPAAIGDKPNIVVIMLDDMGVGDIGAYGGVTVQTPVMDQLATDGIRFTEHYANAPICSPSRAAIHTGHYPQAYGIRRVIPPESDRGLPLSPSTLPEMLSSAGYVTGIFGKWHLGDAEASYLPNAQGYDESAIYVRNGDISYIDPEILVDDTLPTVPHVGHLTEIITDYAISFITANQAQPFFAHIWHLAPHAPYEPPAFWAAQYPATNPGRYSALIAHADDEIDRIISTLSSLSLLSDTLIMVTSDNGSSMTSISANGPYLGAKEDVYEGGIRAPLIVRWDGEATANTTNDTISVGFDLIPTLAEQLVVDVTGYGLAGQSILSALTSGSTVARSGDLFWETKDSTSYVIPASGELNRFAVRSGDWKLVQQDNSVNSTPLLFDLSLDPYEGTDVAGANPSVVTTLLAEYRDWRMEQGLLPFSVDSSVGNTFINGETHTFWDGEASLTNDTQFNFHDADFTFHSKVTFFRYGGIGRRQVIAERLDSWTLSRIESGRLELVVYGPGKATSTTLLSTQALALDTEYDLAFSVFGWRDSPSTVSLYVDNELQQQTNVVTEVNSTTNTIVLGRVGSDGFRGTLENPRLYRMHMSLQELIADDGGGPINCVDDVDVDSVGDACDNCWKVPNGPAQTGIPGVGNQDDMDADGVGDACDFDGDGDLLPNVFETDTQLFIDETDTGTDPWDPDSDTDGHLDGDEVEAGTDPNSALSVPLVFSVEASFLGAIPIAGVFDWESLNAIALSGETFVFDGLFNSISFTVPSAIIDVRAAPPSGGPNPPVPFYLQVTRDWGNNPSTSGVKSLGTFDAPNLNLIAAGTDLHFTFPQPMNAFGMTVITPAVGGVDLFDGDVQLYAPGAGVARLKVSDGGFLVQRSGVDYYAYFIGVVAQTPFNRASLTYGPGVPHLAFSYNTDDFLALPEPSGPLLLLAGIAGALLLGRLRGGAAPTD